jgi:hypothetical protein
MAKKFIIISNSVLDQDKLLEFQKTISSNYINVRAAENFFLVITEDDVIPKQIHDKMNIKLKDSMLFIVIELDTWYGNLYTEAVDWLEEKFPEEKFEK